MGLTESKDPVKIEQDLMRELPAKEWIVFSHRMIQHGRRVCMAPQSAVRRVRAGRHLPSNRRRGAADREASRRSEGNAKACRRKTGHS